MPTGTTPLLGSTNYVLNQRLESHDDGQTQEGVEDLEGRKWLRSKTLAIVASLDYRKAGCVSGEPCWAIRRSWHAAFFFLLHHGNGIMREIDLAKALDLELHHRGVVFDYGQLLEFVECIWADAKKEPDVNRWADEFMLEAALPAK
jgi:hypothetical protein